MITYISLEVNRGSLINCAIMPKSPLDQGTRDFLIRGLPVVVADKLKVAASLHKVSMKEYICSVLEGHLSELEKKGIKLALGKGK
jgi:hypothetical protein